MLGILNRLLLFISSYTPLYAIVAHLQWGAHRDVSYAAIGLAGIGLLGLALAATFRRTTQPVTITAENIQRKDTEALAYLFTYVFPFLGTNYAQVNDAVPFVILFATVAVIYVSSNLIHVNPLLNALGWHIYEVSAGGRPYTVITRKAHLQPGDPVTGVIAGDETLWSTKRK